MSEKLIEEILDLRRVPRRLRASARLRLEDQSSAELDQKAQRLRSQRKRIAEWSRPYLATARKAKEKKNLWEALTKHKVLKEVASESNPEDLVAKALRSEQHAVGSSSATTASAVGEAAQAVYARALRRIVDEEMQAQIGSAAVVHPVVSEISVGGFINALGRLENEMEVLRPDAIVTLNKGGMCVANLLMNHINLSAPIYGVSGAADTQIEWLQAVDAIPDGVVCVVGHVAHTGLTMGAVIRSAKAMFKTSRVYGAVIAASDQALNGGLRQEKLIFHQKTTANALTIGESVQVSSYSPSEDIIRAILDGDSVTLDEGTVHDIRRYMADRYPVTGIDGWQGQQPTAG